MPSGTIKEIIPRPVLPFLIVLALLIGSGGILFFSFQKRKIENEKQNELIAIASLKTKQIESWRVEHIRDGIIIESILSQSRLTDLFYSDTLSPSRLTELTEELEIFLGVFDYYSMLFIDTTATIRFIYPPAELNPTLYTFLPEELKSPDINLSDLHHSTDLPGKISIHLRIPIFDDKKTSKPRIGTLLLKIDPEKIFYPLIQSWPTPSKTSETLLIRQAGDSVLFLNELRHKKNTALKFRLPLKEDLPAAKAVQGYEGVFEGSDYRGVEVVSYLNNIPSTLWFMVAKVDKRELYAPLKEIALFILTIAFLLILLLSVSMVYFWRAQHIRHLSELNSTKDLFFSIISHDLRSPFASISGLSELLLNDLQTFDANKTDMGNLNRTAELIRQSTMNACDLLDNLSEWSRLNTGRFVFNPSKTDLAEIIDMVAELMHPLATQKSIVISKSVPSRLIIFADKEMISLVLRNLISNSIKFTHPGGKIHITVIEKSNEVVVDIYDTGVGIDEATVQKLISAEEPVSTPGTLREKGSGLGLILVKKFIALHGWRFLIESEAGKFSRFSFIIPSYSHTRS